MSNYVVTLEDYTPGARFDGLPWTEATIGEAAASTGPFNTIATITLSPVDSDPTSPQERSFTTSNAVLSSGWYLVTFVDAAGDMQPTLPVPYPPPAPQARTGYCSVLDVQARTALRPVTPSSVPNIAQVQQFISDTAAEMEAVLINKGYQVPVVSASNPGAFSLLHGMNVTGAWMLMEQAAPSSPNIDRAAAAWTAALNMLSAADFVMDAPMDVTRAEPRGPWLTTHPSGRTFDPMDEQIRLTDCGPHDSKRPMFSRSMEF